MKNWDPKEIRRIIEEKIPDGKVIPRHSDKGHFYEITEDNFPVYPSVTTKLNVLKDEGLMNYKMNRAIEYVFTHFKEFNDSNIMEQLDIASRVSQDILEGAGDIGTIVHKTREDIFNSWIETGKRPEDFLAFIKPGEEDIRVISCIRALQKFCIERDYIPIHCELLVYNHKYKIAGTLDDLGLIKKVGKNGKESYQFCLMDLKTSNAFKDHYFFQVAMYNWMFQLLTGLKTERLFILKVSKEDGTYLLEDIRKPGKLVQYAKNMLKTNEGINFIKSLRKDNQKIVAPLMEL